MIEGLPHGGSAQRMRQLLADFGSGWIRKALSKGIDIKNVQQAADKLGYKRYSRLITETGEGEKFIREGVLGRGGMGEVTRVRSLATGS